MDLSNLSNLTLSMLAAREDLTHEMIVVIVAELRSRREAREAAAQVAAQVAALASYYETSVGGSVLADYRSGNVTIIKAN